MTVFAAASSREFLIIVVTSIGAAILVNIPTIAALFLEWIGG
jgi:hypothetical protein